MPEVFYQQLRRQRRRAALSVTAFVLTLCLLPLALIAFRRYPLLGTALLAGCAAMVLACYRVRRVPPDAPALYSAPILVNDSAARLVACGAEQVGADAQLGKYTAGAFAAAGGTDRAGGRCARAGCAAVPSAAPVGHAGGGARIRDSGTAADRAVSGGVSVTGVLIFPVSDGILRCGGARI